MSKQLRLTLVAAFVLGALVLSLVRFWPARKVAAAAPSGDSAETSAVVTTTRGIRAENTPELTAGTSLVYALDFTSNALHTPDEATAPGRTFMSLSCAASLELRVREKAGENLVLDVRITDLSVALDDEGADSARVTALMRRDFGETFQIVLSPRGRVEELRLSPTLDTASVALLRMVVANAQFVEPAAGARPETWTVEEPDQYGIARVRYRAVAPFEYEKTKLGYSKFELSDAFAGKRGARAKVDSKALVRCNAERIVERATTDETTTLPFGDGALASQSHMSLVLKSTQRGLPRLASHELKDVGLSAHPEFTNGKSVHLPGPAKAFADLWPTVAAAASISDPGDKLDLLDELSKSFEADRTNVAEALRLLRQGQSGATTDLLLGSLASADSKEAEDGLTELVTDATLPDKLRTDAMIRLGLREQPSGESIAAIERVATTSEGELKEAATLSLGSAARRGAAFDDEAAKRGAERATETLIRGLENARSSDERKNYLGALGNAGAPGTLPQIQRALADPNPGVRAAAVRALRLVPDPKADQLIAVTMVSDPSEPVRVAALSAAESRKAQDPIVTAALQSLAQEQNPGMRLQAITGVLRRAVPMPNVVAALERVVQSDPVEDVKIAAGSALALVSG